jgi:DNA-binding NtrC family response regulator
MLEGAKLERAKKILIVDDDPILVSALAIPLRAYFFVDVAKSYHAGLKAVRDEVRDVVLLDCNLGEGSGLDLLGPLLEKSPNAVPIMISGEAEINTVLRALELGAMDYVVKDQRLLQEILIRIPIALKRKTGSQEQSAQAAETNLPTQFSELNFENYTAFMKGHEKIYFERALELARFDVSNLARVLGISRSTIHSRMNDLQISRKTELRSTV